MADVMVSTSFGNFGQDIFNEKANYVGLCHIGLRMFV